MTTDLRAALRDAVALLREDAQDHIDDARKMAAAPLLEMAERITALADARDARRGDAVTWIDEKRTDAEVRCRLDVGPVTIEIRGHLRTHGDLTWAWQWWLPHAHTVRTTSDEASAKAAALAAFDAWIAEIVDARKDVTP